MKIAAVIGHSAESPGAWSPFLCKNEYFYFCEVSRYLEGAVDIFRRPSGGGYKMQMRKLADQLNPKNYDLVLEMHFNSFDQIANKRGIGTEAVIWKGNSFTERIGREYCEAVSKEYGTENRGVKYVEEGGRGYWFLKYQKAPAIILEPFFGDEEEASKFEHPGRLAEVMKRVLCG